VDDLPAPEKASEAQIRQVMDREGQALLRHVKPTDRMIALCIRAEAPDSVKLSRILEGWSGDGRRNVFVIGGSNGLSEAVLRRVDERLSFSNLTFPHGLMRVILLEQLYRAERIRTGEPYHK
jgi:23S rRNA (pseudouridine1915-N3)-methyltransferase